MVFINLPYIYIYIWQICSFIEKTKNFQNKDKSETFDIKKGILNCSTNLVVCLIECKSCSKQYSG